MSYKKIQSVAVASVIAFGAPLSVGAMEILFQQDFEAGLGANEFIAIDPGEGAGIDTRLVTCGASCPFSVNNSGSQTRNFNVHDQGTNPYAGGNGSAGDLMKWNPNMEGQVLGHVFANYDNYEDNYYQIDNISLSNKLTDMQLMFDFDSWIRADTPDGFAVSINDGSGWGLLNPTAASDMQYRTIGTIGDSSLNALSGQSTSTGSPIIGFDGWDNAGNPIDMAGTAMFDIANSFAGSTISLRFAFASGASFEAEGINIDNLKVTGVCTSGSGSDCGGPSGGGVPEPGTLTLAMIGMAAAYRSRKKMV
jgi:PEP-CTERM motif